LLNSISSRFVSKAFWDHDIDLSGSCDVIGHVTIRFPTSHFLFASLDSFLVRRTVYSHDAYVTDDRQTTNRRTQHCSVSANVSTVG